MGFFAFVWPALADVASATLVVLAIALLIRHRVQARQAPLVIAGISIFFVLASAAYATLGGLPGNHFGSVGKHIPIALGPLVVLPVNAACVHFTPEADFARNMLFIGADRRRDPCACSQRRH